MARAVPASGRPGPRGRRPARQWISPARAELWLYRPTTGLQLMFRFGDGITRAIAGGCS